MSGTKGPGRLGRLLGARRPVAGALTAIVLVVGGAAAAFAFTAGWLTPQRLTPDRIVDALSRRGGDPLGHRRNHAKGICFTGYFEASGEGARLSAAPMLAKGRYPVVGRFAIAVADPLAKDATGRVRSMAVRITSPDGQEWRSGMNAMPVFPVATPRAFYEQVLAADVDPRTGKPDPEAMKRFLAAHPETRAFAAWAKSAPWTASYADQSYNSLNAFRFVDRSGASRAVRWSMLATTPMQPVALDELKKLGPDFLETDLKRRLGEGELRWNLVATLAEPGDPTNDATEAWPADRPQVALGTLVVQKAQDEADGPCRDLNYDPTILPRGVQPSDDPLLAARSASYAVSFDRRAAEAAHYPRTPRTEGASR
jgi:catalase